PRLRSARRRGIMTTSAQPLGNEPRPADLGKPAPAARVRPRHPAPARACEGERNRWDLSRRLARGSRALSGMTYTPMTQRTRSHNAPGSPVGPRRRRRAGSSANLRLEQLEPRTLLAVSPVPVGDAGPLVGGLYQDLLHRAAAPAEAVGWARA